MKKWIVLLIIFIISGCASIKPMEIPKYTPPDYSNIKRPDIQPLEIDKDFTVDYEKGTITYSLSGQNKLTAKVISERLAWQIIEMLKQTIDIQAQLVNQERELLIVVDLKRQIAERGQHYSDIKALVAEIVAFVAIGLAIAGLAVGL